MVQRSNFIVCLLDPCAHGFQVVMRNHGSASYGSTLSLAHACARQAKQHQKIRCCSDIICRIGQVHFGQDAELDRVFPSVRRHVPPSSAAPRSTIRSTVRRLI